MKDFWGCYEDDLVVDKSTPMLIKMLAMTEEILAMNGKVHDAGLSDALNVIDIQGKLIDILAGVRAYQKKREKEIEKEQ